MGWDVFGVNGRIFVACIKATTVPGRLPGSPLPYTRRPFGPHYGEWVVGYSRGDPGGRPGKTNGRLGTQTVAWKPTVALETQTVAWKPKRSPWYANGRPGKTNGRLETRMVALAKWTVALAIPMVALRTHARSGTHQSPWNGNGRLCTRTVAWGTRIP